MRKFQFEEAHGLDLVKEFAKRIVADEYDSLEGPKINEDSIEFRNWLEYESNRLYNGILESINAYVDNGSIDTDDIKEW